MHNCHKFSLVPETYSVSMKVPHKNIQLVRVKKQDEKRPLNMCTNFKLLLSRLDNERMKQIGLRVPFALGQKISFINFKLTSTAHKVIRR